MKLTGFMQRLLFTYVWKYSDSLIPTCAGIGWLVGLTNIQCGFGAGCSSAQGKGNSFSLHWVMPQHSQCGYQDLPHLSLSHSSPTGLSALPDPCTGPSQPSLAYLLRHGGKKPWGLGQPPSSCNGTNVHYSKFVNTFGPVQGTWTSPSPYLDCVHFQVSAIDNWSDQLVYFLMSNKNQFKTRPHKKKAYFLKMMFKNWRQTGELGSNWSISLMVILIVSPLRVSVDNSVT